MKFLIILLLSVFSRYTYSQEVILKVINETVNKVAAEKCISFLASDKMRGRGTGTPEIDLAADYLAKEFKTGGIRKINDITNYFQEVEMIQPLAPSKINFTIEEDSFSYVDDLLMIYRGGLSYEGELVFVGYGQDKDFAGVDVKGKIVVSMTGTSDSTTGHTHTSEDLKAKQLRSKENGARALIEILTFKDVEWAALSDFLVEKATEVTFTNENGYIPHYWMRDSDSESLKKLMNEGKAYGRVIVQMPNPIPFSDNNVIGWIEGTDPKLKEEYVVLSAHYDHIGVFKTNRKDSIHNGARDNGIGTAAILLAGKALVKNPPKRSVIIMALCAEEIDLLGSEWYVRHPLVPLNQTVYNLNCDGAGYNDKRLMTVIDFNRTTADDMLKQASNHFGLKLVGDPEPQEDLYENSDNYNFAKKGIPSVNIAPGVKKFNRKLMKYYHRPSDEVSSLDFKYLEKFLRAFTYSAFLVANAEETPEWVPGDEFEETGKKLYSSKE